MYEIDDQDTVIERKDIPQSCVGAPMPVMIANERKVLIAYYLQNRPENWDGKKVKIMNKDTEGEPIAMVAFKLCYSHMFGLPNDEAFSGHPLSERGLEPYGVFEIQPSSWLRKLETMNSVHYCHSKKHFMAGKKHYVFALNCPLRSPVSAKVATPTSMWSESMRAVIFADTIPRHRIL